MSEAAVRVISLLPAAIGVASLGMLDALLGVSQVCDYPEEVNRKPRVTGCEIPPRVSRARKRTAGYARRCVLPARSTDGDADLVHRLRPDAILTQRFCDVYVNYGSVARFAATLPGSPRVVSLEPRRHPA